MKLAIYYPKNVYASWYTLGGYRETLEQMGHEVLDCPLPGNHPHDLPRLRTFLPTIEKLNEQDVIISFFHEYTQPWLRELYGASWKGLTTPVIARFDESFDRADIGLPDRWPELRDWADHFSFPAHQDAKRFGGQFLPFGVDPRLFNRGPCRGCGCRTEGTHASECAYKDPGALRTVKKYTIGFIGSMYQARVAYLEKLAASLPSTLTFQCGAVVVQDVGGIKERETTELLAQNYREFKIFFCLPPMSRLLVCKVFEVMACGTFLMYPKLPGDARRNNEIFENGKHLVYYEYGRVAENAKQVVHYLEHEEEREEIARAGSKKVLKDHTLAQMFEQLLAPVEVKPKLHLVAGS